MVRDANESRVAREVTERMIRTLGLLEVLLLATVGLLALAGGAIAAFLASAGFGLPFRPVWVVASLALFIIPGIATLRRERPTRRRAEIGKRDPSTGGGSE